MSEFNKENKRAHPVFLRDDLFGGEDSPRLFLTKCETFIGLQALAMYFMALLWSGFFYLARAGVSCYHIRHLLPASRV